MQVNLSHMLPFKIFLWQDHLKLISWQISSMPYGVINWSPLHTLNVWAY